MVKIKICGLTRRCDVEQAVLLGADFLGFILTDVSPRFITAQHLKSITLNVPKHVQKVGVFVNESPETINGFSSLIDIVQLHGEESAECIKSIHLPCWKAVNIHSSNQQAYEVDAFLFDAVKGETQLNGHWSLAKALSLKKKLFLAGGISSGNVLQAIDEVSPYGIDLSSSIEIEPGIKSNEKMNQFFKIIGALK